METATRPQMRIKNPVLLYPDAMKALAAHTWEVFQGLRSWLLLVGFVLDAAAATLSGADPLNAA